MKDNVGPVARPASSPRPAEGFWRHRGLIWFAAVGAAAEAGVLLAVAPAARPLAPQVTALAPLALYHDMRWLFGYHRSWLGFAAGAVAVLLARSAVNTALVRLAWPRELPKPRTVHMFWSNLALMALTGLLISPIVVLVFGVALLPFSWPFLPAVLALVLIVSPLSHGGALGSWWRTLPPLRAVGWMLADFVFLSAASAVIALLPAAAAAPAAALAGLVNARAWYGMTSAAARRRPGLARQRMAGGVPVRGSERMAAGFGAPAESPALVLRIPLAPLAAITVLVLTAVATRLVFAAAAGGPVTAGAAAAPAGVAATAQSGGPGAAAMARAVLLIGGFGSPCCRKARGFQQADPGNIVQQFSYLGLDSAGRPIPHGRAPSNLPLPLLGDRIAAQVARLHAETGKPVDLVAESEGTLGVYAMLARHPDAPIGAIVLASPIVAPGQASFPAGGAQGLGVASGYALRAVARVIGRLSPYGPSGALTLIDSVSSLGARYLALAARHQSVRWLAVIPLADAVTLPVCALPPDVVVVPGFHGGLLGRQSVQRMVRSFVTGGQVHGREQLKDAAEVLAATAAGWGMPQVGVPSPPCRG